MPARLEVEVEDVSLPVATSTRIIVRIFRAEEAPEPSPVVLYLCDLADGGRESGPFDEHLRTIAADTGAAVLIPRTDLGPGWGGLEPLYQILCWIAQQGQRRRLDGRRVALAGHGRGAELCSRLALLANERGAPDLRAGSLLWVPDNDPTTWREAARFLSAALRAPRSQPAARAALDDPLGAHSPVLG